MSLSFWFFACTLQWHCDTLTVIHVLAIVFALIFESPLSKAKRKEGHSLQSHSISAATVCFSLFQFFPLSAAHWAFAAHFCHICHNFLTVVARDQCSYLFTAYIIGVKCLSFGFQLCHISSIYIFTYERTNICIYFCVYLSICTHVGILYLVANLR